VKLCLLYCSTLNDARRVQEQPEIPSRAPSVVDIFSGTVPRRMRVPKEFV